MENGITTVTFKDPKGNKATVKVTLEDGQMTINTEFKPTIKGDSKVMYASLALFFVDKLAND